MPYKRGSYLSLPKRKSIVPPLCVFEMSQMLSCWAANGPNSAGCVTASGLFLKCMTTSVGKKRDIPPDINRTLRKFGMPQLVIPRYNK